MLMSPMSSLGSTDSLHRVCALRENRHLFYGFKQAKLRESCPKNKCKYYSISNRKAYSILEVAKMFKRKITLLKQRPGERYASALTKISNDNKIIQKYGKIQLKDYVSSFIKGS